MHFTDTVRPTPADRPKPAGTVLFETQDSYSYAMTVLARLHHMSTFDAISIPVTGTGLARRRRL